MVGCTAQLTGVESGPHIVVVINLVAADRREDAVLHSDAVHVRNPGRGIHDVEWVDFMYSFELELVQGSLR